MNKLEDKYYVVKERAVSEVLLKVVKVKALLNSDKNISVSDAAKKYDLSRSSYYKYKDDIFPFYDNSRGRTITLSIEMYDKRGLLSEILKKVSEYQANILTIHQSIPVNNIAGISLSIEVLEDTGNISAMIEDIEKMKYITDLKILARE